MRRDLFRHRAFRVLGAALLAGVAGLSSACTSGQTAGQAPSYVIIDELDSAQGNRPNEFLNQLSSDVVTEGTVYEDIGRVLLRLAMRDPGSIDTPLFPTTANYITMTRYHVRYVRSDGKNTPGVHVPYPFDGGMTVTVVPAGSISTFTLVRVQSKLEAPLLPLRNLGGAVAITTLAEVTFYGRDQAGREVSVMGTMMVNFADYGDPN